FQNIPLISVTAIGVQVFNGWLKLVSWNIQAVAVTLEIFQLPIGWLKAYACLNISRILVTFDVFHVLRGRLKALALLNALSIFVTAEVFQLPMGWSKVCAPSKILFI